MLKTACGNGFPLNIPSEIPTGGGGGTGDYSDLTNKPKINDVTLSGEMSSVDLGLAAADDIPGLATANAPGIVQPDGTTITIEDGVISAVGGSGSGEVYSATPVKIGTWLGDDLYRVVISAGALPTGTAADVVKEVNATIITGTLVMAQLYARGRNDSNNMLSIPYTSVSQITNCITWRYVDNAVDGHEFIITLAQGNDQSSNDLYIIAYFTV